MTKSRYLSLGISLLIIAVAGAAVYFLVRFLVENIRGVNPTVFSSVIAGCVTVIASVLTITAASKRALKEAHRERKIEIYSAFMTKLFTALKESRDNKEKSFMDEPGFLDYVWKFNQDLTLWASPQVIRAYLEFRRAAGSGQNTILAGEKLYRAFRDDLGLSNRGLKAGDLLLISLKDPNEKLT